MPSPTSLSYTPIGADETAAYNALLAAFTSGEERPIKNAFEAIAEYDIADDYFAWCAMRKADPLDPAVEAQYGLCHWSYTVAWQMLGWDEFQRLLGHARMITSTYL